MSPRPKARQPRDDREPARSRARRLPAVLRRAALAILLLLAVTRMLLTESLVPPWTMIGFGAGGGDAAADAVNWGGPTPASSMGFALWICVAGLLWLVAQWTEPRALVGRWALLFVGLFVLAGVVSFAGASNKAAARNTAVQFAGYLLGFWLMLQLLATRRARQAALVAVLAGGVAFAANALYQRYYENPQFVHCVWPEKRAEFFKSQGWQPDDPLARQYEERVQSSEVKGFAVNANMAAALLILVTFAGAGWGIQKIANSRTKAPNDKRGAPTIPLRIAFGVIVLAMSGVCAWALVLTRSRGGIAAGAGGVALFVTIALTRRWASRHWRGLLVATGATVLLGAAALTVFGARMRQPAPDSVWYRNGAAQSLLVRWHYWTGAVGAWRDAPWTGVGGGNFRTAYQQHKPAAALEDVDNPHNFALAALVEFGPLGAISLIGLLAWVFVTIARPSPVGRAVLGPGAGASSAPDAVQPPSGRSVAFFVLAICLGVAALRTFIQWPNRADLLTNLGIALLGPAVVAMLLLSRDRADWPTDVGEDWVRLAIGCGLAGFLLACTIDFGMSQAGSAVALWTLAAIAAASRPVESEAGPARRGAWAIAGLVGLAATVFVVGWVYRPVAEAECAVARGQFAVPILCEDGEVRWGTDSLDPTLWERIADWEARTGRDLVGETTAFERAHALDPANPQYLLRLGQTLLSSSDDAMQTRGRQCLLDAARRAPRSAAVWRQAGRLLLSSRFPEDAERLLAGALAIDDTTRRYDPKGLFALSPTERRNLEGEHAQAVARPKPMPSTDPSCVRVLRRLRPSQARDH